ncbi:MAG: hypothetical protein ACRD9W_04560 [Terriglobia bacterium]
MSGKIAFLNKEVISPAVLLAQVAEREGLEAVVILVRVNGCWISCQSSSVTTAGLSMAALKLLSDAQDLMHDVEASWSPPEGDAA